MKKAKDYLQACIEVQKERGEEYDSKGTGERSFAACATAYNAIQVMTYKVLIFA